ncbi:hypothetical protein NKH77_26150 [Streptomyces sp. M19]
MAAADTHSASAAEARSDVGTAAAQRVTLSNGAWEPTGDDHTTFDTVKNEFEFTRTNGQRNAKFDAWTKGRINPTDLAWDTGRAVSTTSPFPR